MGFNLQKLGIARIALYAVAIGAVIILFDFAIELRESAEEQEIAEVRSEATVFTQDVRRTILTTIDNVSSVGAFFESSNLVNEQEFSRFVSRSNLLTGQGHVRSISAMPLLDHKELPRFLEALDARKYVRETIGYGPTRIQKTPGREIYAPAVYVESIEGRNELLGYDLGTDPVRMKIAGAAMRELQPHMTPPTRLIQDHNPNRVGIMIVGAVKSEGNLGMRYYLPEEADRRLLIVASFSPDIALNDLLSAYSASRFALRISDTTEQQDLMIFETDTPYNIDTHVHEEGVVLGKRIWTFKYSYSGLAMQSRFFDRFMILGFIGAAAIIALAVALDRLLRIRGRLEQDVQERTLELQNVNAALIDAAQKASAESEAKSMFLAHMSHELRTPLNAVIGYGQMLQAEIFGKIGDNRYLDYAKTIVDAGTIQLSLVEDLLALTALDTDGRDLVKSDIDMDELAKRCIDLVQTKADEKSIDLQLESSLGLQTLSSDQRAVQQILTNLLSNAVKFTEEGGSIIVHLDQGRNGQISISVEDDGIGIPEEQVDKVLQPFSRAHEDPYQTHEGVGLGLSIVRGLADACGANVNIKSEKGVGTKVTVIFPMHSPLSEQISED